MTGAADRSAARARAGLGWLSALVLFVLVVAAGLPAGRDPVAGSAGIEVVECAPSRALVAAAERRAVAEAPQPAPARVRVVPRTRSVAARGLPPPRAPTA